MVTVYFSIRTWLKYIKGTHLHFTYQSYMYDSYDVRCFWVFKSQSDMVNSVPFLLALLGIATPHVLQMSFSQDSTHWHEVPPLPHWQNRVEKKSLKGAEKNTTWQEGLVFFKKMIFHTSYHPIILHVCLPMTAWILPYSFGKLQSRFSRYQWGHRAGF